MKLAVIFGGTGFIGSYFADQLINDGVVDKVVLADLNPICHSRFGSFLDGHVASGRIEYVKCDVRQGIGEQVGVLDNVFLIANLAAIHREPGHRNCEYYETNILGAENVCEWASHVGCDDIIFTSSIAPYGPSESPKNESSIPCPVSGYGGSKLVAEKIHIAWMHKKQGRNLTIVRPGVVFGAGEGGNVSRLIKATLKGYFFYMGNKNTRKAGVYVRELTRALLWVHSTKTCSGGGCVLFNMSMNPAPSVKE
jgi:GlcNAc-P-P-Und epimerase